MYSDTRLSTRSPTGSRTDSYADGPGPRSNVGAYQTRSSVTEDTVREDNEYEEAPDDIEETSRAADRPPQRSEDQYIAALRYRFPNRAKDDYAYKKTSWSCKYV